MTEVVKAWKKLQHARIFSLAENPVILKKWLKILRLHAKIMQVEQGLDFITSIKGFNIAITEFVYKELAW